MRALPGLTVLVLLLAALASGCDGDEAAKSTDTGSEVQPSDDPAEPAGETDSGGESDAGDESDDPGDIDTGGLPDISGFDCDVEVEVTGAVSGTLEGGTAVTNDAGGPKAFYQLIGEDLLLSAYSVGQGVEPSVILQSDSGTYGSDPGAAGLDIREDGSGFTVDTEVKLIPSGGRTAHVAGTMVC